MQGRWKHEELITAIHPETGIEVQIKKKQLWARIKKLHKDKYKYIIWRISTHKYQPVMVGIYWFEEWEDGKTC